MRNATLDLSTLSSLVETYLPELPVDAARKGIPGRLIQETVAAAAAAEVVPDAAPAPYDRERDPDGRMRDYFAHFVNVWGREVVQRATGSPVVARENDIVDDFVTSQVGVVSNLMIRTLLEELYRRRAQGLLPGDTAEDRYRSFRLWTNSGPGHAELLARYPHLFASVRARVVASATFVAHVIREFERYREQLVEQIPGVRSGSRIAGVTLGQGDTHHGGKSVARIRLDDGGRMLYKPHPMEAEAGYHRFVDWMSGQLGDALPTISVFPTDSGGFVEHVPTAESPDVADERYFVHMGQLAGILYLLRATDIHYENVVTSTDGPVVVDAETVLTPRLRAASADADSAGRLAAQMIRESVVGIGILPMVMRARTAERGLDVGVIGYDPGQRFPFKVLAVKNHGRDDMFAEFAEVEETSPSANVSVSRAVAVPVRRQRDIIKQEFRRVLEYARTHVDEVMDVIEKYLGDARFRYVNHATVFYSQLLRMATHPDAVADAGIRSAVLSRVSILTGDAYEIAREEVRQLALGDVPYFSHSPRSRALLAGEKVVRDDAFEEPGLAAVRARLTGLDTETIAAQLRLIDISFLNKFPAQDGRTGFSPTRPGHAPARPARRRFVEEATRIGDGLVSTIVDGSDQQWPATWIAPQIMVSAEENQWTPGAIGYDIYGGGPGVALALAGLARETGDRRYRHAARRVIEPFEGKLANGAMRGLKLSPGAMSGLAGTIYAIATAKRLLGIDGVMTAGELAAELVASVTAEAEPEFVSGLAGALAVGLALHRSAAPGADRAAVGAAVRTIAQAQLRSLGTAEARAYRVTPYTGYAHGAMGIAPTLIEYGAAFDDPHARDLGLRIVGAVLDAYDERDGDWPKKWEGEQPRSYGWCHGAPGILLGCLSAVRHGWSSIPGDKLARLAELTLHRAFGHNPSYCHGDLGGVEIVAVAEREAPDLFDQGTARKLYERLFAEVVERYDERVDSRFAYSNSLMVGQAGFAWSILRHLEPEIYPSILRLE